MGALKEKSQKLARLQILLNVWEIFEELRKDSMLEGFFNERLIRKGNKNNCSGSRT